MVQAFIVCGAPGSGKSTYAHQLAASINAMLVDIDIATARLVSLALELTGKDPCDRDSAFFKQNFRVPIYEQMFDIAVDNLAFNQVVIVGPFTQEIQDPLWPTRLADRLKVKVAIHYVSCSPEVRKSRMQRRGHSRDVAKFKDWDQYIQYYQDEKPPCFEHVFINNDREGVPKIEP